MDVLEKEILETATHKSGAEFNNLLNLLLKKVSDDNLKKIIAEKKEEIKKAKYEQIAAQCRIELKRVLKEFIRSGRVMQFKIKN